MSTGVSLARLWAILLKELIQLKRNRATLAVMVMIPIMQLMLFGYAINTDPKHLPTVLLAQDHSVFTRSVLAGLKNADYFSFQKEASSEAEAQELLREGKTQFVITIPENFARNIVRGEKPALSIETDATDPTASANALASLDGILARVAAQDLKGPLAFLKKKSAPFSATIHKLYNPEGFSRYNIVPGLMGIVLTMTGIMMTALSLTRERERGTMENLLAMPVSPFEVMAGKIAPYVLIGYVQATLIVLAAKFLFGVPILGSLALLSAVLIIFLICNLALGFMISAVAENQMMALQLSFFLFLPSVMLSGFMFPFRGMPDWAQAIGSALPATYFIRVVRGVLLKGNDLIAIWPDVWPLLLFMVLTTGVAIKLYKQTLD